ncbi:unnamed protein product [Peniophora sp. CBMAI 1063]|nr:unnamed protein product [Peniophora sp. CBMAI 1063]
MQNILQANLNPASHILQGHICATFGSEEARLYWQRVLGLDTANLYPATNGNGERRIMLPSSPQSPAPPHALPGIPGCWVVDYMPLFHLGPIVRQQPYVPTGTHDQVAPHYQGLRAPIWFIKNNGTLGISLVDAIGGRADTLLWESQSKVQGTRAVNTHFTIRWPYYGEFSKLVNLYDSRREFHVKYGQLARKVANFMGSFLEEAAQQPGNHAWVVQNTDHFMARILIVGLVQVTAGHYQPIIQLCHGDARLW